MIKRRDFLKLELAAGGARVLMPRKAKGQDAARVGAGGVRHRPTVQRRGPAQGYYHDRDLSPAKRMCALALRETLPSRKITGVCWPSSQRRKRRSAIGRTAPGYHTVRSR